MSSKDSTYQNLVTSNTNHGCDILMTERGARPPNNILQLLCGHLILFDKFRNDVDGDTRIVKTSPALEFFSRDCRESVWNKKTTVVGQTSHDDGSEIEALLATTGRRVGYGCHISTGRVLIWDYYGCTQRILRLAQAYNKEKPAKPVLYFHSASRGSRDEHSAFTKPARLKIPTFQIFGLSVPICGRR